jgi:hypothetical protein
MMAFNDYLSRQKSVPALRRSRLALMQIADFDYRRRACETVNFTGLQNLPDRSMQYVEHVFGAPVGEHRTSIDNLILLEKYPVHRQNPG